METSSLVESRPNMLSFKSYYVVWKLFTPWMIQENDIVFKSYYVVWKQDDGIEVSPIDRSV